MADMAPMWLGHPIGRPLSAPICCPCRQHTCSIIAMTNSLQQNSGRTVLGRYVSLPPLGAWSWSGPGFSQAPAEASPLMRIQGSSNVMRESCQALTRMEKHAGSLEALRVTRPEAVVLAGNNAITLFFAPSVAVAAAGADVLAVAVRGELVPFTGSSSLFREPGRSRPGPRRPRTAAGDGSQPTDPAHSP